MSLFKKSWKSGKFVISDKDPVYKVRYLGNVQTALMKGDGCVDKPTGVLWNNFVKNANVGLEMKLSICGSGLKAHTKEQGLTEYRAYRISYCIAHPKYPKLFVWVYRHEGKKMKVELRCHAVLCKTEAKAKAMALQLHEKLSMALAEFLRDKTRRQNTRLALQRTNSCPTSSSGISGIPMRTKFLSTAQNFKPSNEKSAGAPRLGAISEGIEEEPEEELEDDLEEVVVSSELKGDDEVDDEEGLENMRSHRNSRSMDETTLPSAASSSSLPEEGALVNGDEEMVDGLLSLEIGNDIDELRGDSRVQYHYQHDDSDDDSSESGFSEQDKDAGSVCSANGAEGGAAHAHGSSSQSAAGADGKKLLNGACVVDTSNDSDGIELATAL